MSCPQITPTGMTIRQINLHSGIFRGSKKFVTKERKERKEKQFCIKSFCQKSSHQEAQEAQRKNSFTTKQPKSTRKDSCLFA
jgi:hypothetical protein